MKAQHGALMFTNPAAAATARRRCAIRWRFPGRPAGRAARHISGCEFYIGAAQFEYWRHTQLIIDVVPGRGSGFSAEAPEGVRFLTRSRVFSDEEVAELEAADPPLRAA